MTTVLDERVQQLQDEITGYVDDWGICLDMIAEGEQIGPKKVYCDYLELLAQRTKRMNRKWNRVEEDKQTQVFKITNYTYETYLWALKRKLDPVITPFHLYIDMSKLTANEVQHFRETSRK